MCRYIRFVLLFSLILEFNMKAMTICALTGLLTFHIGLSQASDSSGLTFTTIAGKADTFTKSVDGTGSAAEFYAPRGVAVDTSGNVYVADSSNHTIRKVTANGVTTTIAGSPGNKGYQNGMSTAARFTEPFSVAVDGSGALFIADTSNNAIRKITADGVVSTLAGGNGKGSNDGVGTTAKFSEPRGLALDASGNIFVTDYENQTIRKVTADGVVSTFAGSVGIEGFSDGQGTSARFKSLQGLTIDSAGNLYVADAGNRSIRKISSKGLVTTLANGSAGQFGQPRGLAVDTNQNVYVADYGANAIWKITAAGVISKLAGTPPATGSADGAVSTALFNAPSGVAVDSMNNVYVADTLNNTIRKISSDGIVTTLAGLAGRSSSRDGLGTAARFEDPYAVAADGSHNLYVADATDHTIRKIAEDGTVTTFAGKAGSFGSADGKGSSALFKEPLGIAADTTGNVYVADTGNNTIRKITPAGLVSTLAGTAGKSGSTDGVGAAARFNSPSGVATDNIGNVYVIESSANVLRKISPEGVVTTLAGKSGVNGMADGSGTAASFSVPFDLVLDSAGNIYVCDHGNHAIRKVTAAGVVTTLAGSGKRGNADGSGRSASFNFPSGVAVDSSGNVYVADTDNQSIRKISPDGEVTTVGGGNNRIGSVDGIGTVASFNNPKDVAVDNSDNLYVVDRSNHTIRKSILSTAAVALPANDCLFNWLEDNYPAYVSPNRPASLTSSPFYFRYYTGTNSYIGVSSADAHLYYSSASAGLLDLGLAATWSMQAGCR